MTGKRDSAEPALSSMTGFARAEGAQENWRWAWEVRSVNGRSLEARFRLPPGFDAIEPAVRAAAKEQIARGNLSASLTLAADQGGALFRVNREALDAAIDLVREIEARRDCAPTSAAAILSLRGVMEAGDGAPDEEALEALRQAMISSFDEALAALKEARANEGAALLKVLNAQIDQVEALVESARTHAAAAPANLRARLAAQIAELIDGAAAIPEDRLAQEAAMLAVKADIREELDRLQSHIEAARALLSERAPVGRRFDFLTQEFNREANTLCSKASDIDLKRVGLELKSVIDQMREQVQNIE